ncbi:MAG: LCP family protein [Acidimicrobiales bacterium]
MAERKVPALVVAALIVNLLIAACIALVTIDPGSSGVATPGPGPVGPALELRKVDQATFAPAADRPFFVAVIGNDARPGDTVSRADALHLVGVNPALGRATILNIPRDTYVQIPGRGMDKINAAHASGGPVAAAAAMGALVGVPVSLVVSTGFVGLASMVDELGGVRVEVPVAMADRNSGAFFPAGPVDMSGAQALAFTRNRNLAGGDFTRTANQGRLIQAALAKLRAEGATASNVSRWLGVLLRNSRVEGLNPAEFYRLGRSVAALDPAGVASITMPGVAGQAGAASVVFAAPGAQTLFANFRDDGIV